MNPFDQLMHCMTATPTLDKLSAFAADWKKADADELAEDDARYWAKQDRIAEARRADREDLDGADEVAA